MGVPVDGDRPRPFRYDAEVPPGEKRRFRHEISETYRSRSRGTRSVTSSASATRPARR